MRINADGAGIDQLGKYHCNSCAILPFKIIYMVLHREKTENSEVFKPVFALLTDFFCFCFAVSHSNTSSRVHLRKFLFFTRCHNILRIKRVR